MVLMKGNEAIAEAAIKSGCKHYFGYPITPQTEIIEYMSKRLPKIGGVCLQAESEIAAINMVLGASATGARVMTSSSSPGISLKSEGISYLVGSDLPCVIVNVQRGGPGLGGIQPAQSDYYQAVKAIGHGDMKLIVFAPNSIQEMAELTVNAFDLADIYRTPVMILADGALGQMMEPVDFDKIISREVAPKDWATNGHNFKRKNNIINSLYITPDELERKVLERDEKYKKIAQNEVKFEQDYINPNEECDIIFVSYGITSRIVKTACDKLRANNIKASYFRPITLNPFPYDELKKLADKTKRFLVCELNMGQMVDDVKLAIECKKDVHFYGRTGGMTPAPDDVYNAAINILS